MSLKILYQTKNKLVLIETKFDPFWEFLTSYIWWAVFMAIFTAFTFFGDIGKIKLTSGDLECQKSIYDSFCLLKGKTEGNKNIERVIYLKDVHEINTEKVDDSNYSYLILKTMYGGIFIPQTNEDLENQRIHLLNFSKNPEQRRLYIYAYDLDLKNRNEFIANIPIFISALLLFLYLNYINFRFIIYLFNRRVIIIDKTKMTLTIGKQLSLTDSNSLKLYIKKIKRIRLYCEQDNNQENSKYWIFKIIYTNDKGLESLLLENNNFIISSLKNKILETRLAIESMCSFLQIEFIDNTNDAIESLDQLLKSLNNSG